MAFHNLSKDKVLADLETDKVTGLSGEEAAKRLEKYGENKLREKKKKTNLQRFFEQFKDVMILILIAAAIVSTVITIINVVKAEPGHKEYSEFFEPALILIIVIINAVMGVVQESKAEKALEALQGLSAPHARVLRDGVQTVINAKDLVPGDVIFLDGSTSAFFMAEYLKSYKNINVITNGIDTLSLLSKNKINAYSTGGKISETNRSALVGQIAINTIKNYHADIAFFSAHSVDKNGEIYDCFEEENYVRSEMMKNSTKKVLLCDSSKLGFTSPYRLCSLKEIDCFVCDKNISNYFNIDSTPKILY